MAEPSVSEAVDSAEISSVDYERALHGNCEGPDSFFIKLISSDCHEFIIPRHMALVSGTIKAMLSGPGQFAENETNYKTVYTNSSTEIPDFPIQPELALELLMAANFLDC
ncbi:putative HEAT repeat-containing domain protein [Trichinella spiralis]|uniref:putative HEAT repeat-containing domain protein n=1 Tax=Trichinella spiralis TaxID=6334 RepID=UPI0001EFF028|nr:putative HEAT repeat-containing domain protein [Trichinella spiralis]